MPDDILLHLNRGDYGDDASKANRNPHKLWFARVSPQPLNLVVGAGLIRSRREEKKLKFGWLAMLRLRTSLLAQY